MARRPPLIAEQRARERLLAHQDRFASRWPGCDEGNPAQGGVVDTLDRDFFRVRFDRLTPKEREYLRAMTELGPGPHRSGDIAAELGIKVQSVAPRRSALIAKGMIFSPAHGDTAFTVPLFDDFMRRTMP